jgi:hypothetical protein
MRKGLGDCTTISLHTSTSKDRSTIIFPLSPPLFAHAIYVLIMVSLLHHICFETIQCLDSTAYCTFDIFFCVCVYYETPFSHMKNLPEFSWIVRWSGKCCFVVPFVSIKASVFKAVDQDWKETSLYMGKGWCLRIAGVRFRPEALVGLFFIMDHL